MALMKVEDALSLLLKDVPLCDVENVSLIHAYERVLATNLKAKRTQPPFNASAMDGYALKAGNVKDLPTRLQIVGEVPAGQAFADPLHNWEAVRIFTGAPVPQGADAVVMQEQTERDGAFVSILEPVTQGQNIRPAGQDFKEGETLLESGRIMSPRDLALAAAMNHAVLPVRKRPFVAILCNGDELVLPGENPSPDQIIASNNFGIAAMAQGWGADVLDLGIARDDKDQIATTIQKASAANVDILVTIGGASVGDHDLVQDALKAAGMDLHFWRIAMRPGKPLLAGKLGPSHVLGLPGNPVSAMVCALLFLNPLIRKMQDLPTEQLMIPARLGAAVKANDHRESYLRASLSEDAQDGPVATPFSDQDSSKLGSFAHADCLIVRPVHALAAQEGTPCQIIRL